MNKNVFAILTLAAVCLAFGRTGYAQTVYTATVDGYTYSYIVLHQKAKLWKDDGKETPAVSPKPTGTLVIPSILNGVPVGYVGWGAFKDCDGLTSVIIPPGVTRISGKAFAGCKGLTSITISPGLILIERSAFEGCEGLTNITIPEGVTTIEEGAFEGCKNLRGITIPQSVTSIGMNVFKGTGLMEAHPDGVVYIDGWACGYKGGEPVGQLTLKEGTRGIADYALCHLQSLTDVIIPEGVKVIGDGAFSGCAGLTGVTLPTGLISIGGYAFSGCRALENVVIPESVMFMGSHVLDSTAIWNSHPENSIVYHGGWVFGYKGAEPSGRITLKDGTKGVADWSFCSCADLTGVIIPEGVRSIGTHAFTRCCLKDVRVPSTLLHLGEDAFSGCTNLTTIIIQPGPTTISRNTFYGCYSLTVLVIPESVTSIGTCAFRGCSSLTGITIPSNVTSIGNSAFSNCKGLTRVVIPESVTSIGDCAFSMCINLTDVTLSSSVSTIGDGAFVECLGLTSIAIPEGVTSIGEYAFARCVNLADVKIPEGVTHIKDYAFSGCSNLVSVVIPESTVYIGKSLFARNALLREVMFLGDAPTASDIYDKAAEELVTYVLPGSTGWDGGANSTALPALWKGRNIMHVSGEPLIAAKAPVAAGATEINEFHAWLDKFFPGNKGDYEALTNKRGANGIPVWDSYVAGLDPTDPKSRFTAFITVEDGKAVIRWAPHLRDRVYTVVGKESLSDTADWGKTNSLTRFFKVRVELPAK